MVETPLRVGHSNAEATGLLRFSLLDFHVVERCFKSVLQIFELIILSLLPTCYSFP